MSSASTLSHPNVPPFPSPSTFSILPDIYILIARLNLLHQPPSQTPTNGHNQSHQQSAQAQTPQIPAPILNGAPLIDTKDLPGQLYPVKQKLVKARAAVESLPDIERTVEEQEVEMRRLEGMVRALRGRLGMLGKIARGGEEGGGRILK